MKLNSKKKPNKNNNNILRWSVLFLVSRRGVSRRRRQDDTQTLFVKKRKKIQIIENNFFQTTAALVFFFLNDFNGMTVLTWCGNKIRNAYEMCKRALCFWTTVGDDESINDNYDVQNRYINGKSSIVKNHSSPFARVENIMSNTRTQILHFRFFVNFFFFLCI